jgi:hypothetical protein
MISSTLHGAHQRTPAASHSDLSMAMMASEPSSQNSWPRVFSW